MAKYRVIHCGTGPTGIPGLRGIVNHPDLELVGHLVFDPAKQGKDSGELCKLEQPTGVKATTSIEDLLALKADYFVYLGDGLGHADNTLSVICRFLEAGVNVGTAALFGTFNARTTPPSIRDPLEAACKKGNSSYYFTGVDPGFINPWLAVAMLEGADEVEEVRMQEIANYAVYPVEWIMRDIFGFGRPKDYKGALSDGDFINNTFAPTVRIAADRLGIELEGTRTFFDNCLHDTAHDTFWGPVEANTVAAVRFGVEGLYKGKPFLIIEHITRTTFDAAPQWPKALFEAGSDMVHQYVVSVKGNPNLRARFDFDLTRDREDAGLAFTAMMVVNAAETIVKHASGIVDEMDVPLYSGKNFLP